MNETIYSGRLTFPKSERLHHRSLIERVFSKSDGSIYDYPLRLSWRIISEEELKNNFRSHVPEGIAPVQMMVSVPKKRLRHAVDRVRMRRIIREAYRLQHHQLRTMIEDTEGIRTLSLAFVYIAAEHVEYSRIERKMRRILSKLVVDITGKSNMSTMPDTPEIPI